MAKFLKRDPATGRTAEESGVAISAGAANSGAIVQLDASGKLDVSVMPSGLGPEVQSIIASEALSAGDFINLWTNASVVNARKADGSVLGKQADGYVIAAFASGATAIIYTDGANTQLSALTQGARYYLSGTTAGAATAVVVTGLGKTHQYLGKAVSATTIQFEPNESIDLQA